MKQTLLLTFIALTLAPSALGQVSQIKKSLICQCGCGMTVEACGGAMTCSSAAKITASIEKMIAEGKSKDEVLAAFVNAYGEEALAAPSKKGFNLTAWVLPFLATFLAGIGIYLGLGKWVRHRNKQAEQNSRRATQLINSEYEALLDKELEEYD